LSLIRLQDFVMHSGDPAYFKLECDALDDGDIAALARIISRKVRFGHVYGVPRGGVRLARALEQYRSDGPVLIVDDVLTTGRSMEEARAAFEFHSPVIGAVIFARGACPSWILPVFRMWDDP
jgi:hypothetical protein